MIDLPHDPPPAQELVIEQSLIKCGLNPKGFTVKYEDELQSIEIVINKQAGASEDMFACIHEAAGLEIVTFRVDKLYQAYAAREFELAKPKLLAEARESLKKRGLLENFPERRNFSSDMQFAEALEKHCEFKPGLYFTESQWGLSVQPKFGKRPIDKATLKKMECLTSALIYVSAKGEQFKYVLIGNEQVLDSKPHPR